MKRFIDATLGKAIRHLFFVLVRSYYALFYNVSCSGKHLLQDQPGTLILATHVSRHDGPLIASLLYTTQRVRPTVHWNEYHNKFQWFPMYVASAIPMSSPKEWTPIAREARKLRTLNIIKKVMDNGNSILIFPAGGIRQQPEEIVSPKLTGVHEILRERPETPVMLLKIDGLGKFQWAKYDGFWSFIGRKKGRRHVSVELTQIEVDPSMELAPFNAHLEDLLNEPLR